MYVGRRPMEMQGIRKYAFLCSLFLAFPSPSFHTWLNRSRRDDFKENEGTVGGGSVRPW